MFEVHYTTNGTATPDQSEVAIKFADRKPDVVLDTWFPFRSRADMVIPANVENHSLQDLYHFGRETNGRPVLLHGIRPHMHSRGKSFRVELVEPAGHVAGDARGLRAARRLPRRDDPVGAGVGLQLAAVLPVQGADADHARRRRCWPRRIGTTRSSTRAIPIRTSTCRGGSRRFTRCSTRCCCTRCWTPTIRGPIRPSERTVAQESGG